MNDRNCFRITVEETQKNLLKHVFFLCKQIPSRKPTSIGERQAAQYVSECLESYGVDDITTHVFKSSSTLGVSTLLSLSLAICAFPIGASTFWIFKLISAFLLFFSSYSLFSMAFGRLPPLNCLIETRKSQNIMAKIPSKSKTINRIFLVSHLDSNKQRFALPFPYPKFMKLIQTSVITIPFLSGCSFLIEEVFKLDMETFQRFTFVTIVIFLIASFFDELQSTVEGANDNASSVSVLLNLAQSISSMPFSHSEIIFLFTGCEEVGCVGINKFLKDFHNDIVLKQRDDVYWINLEMVGVGNLCYATEQGTSYITEYSPSDNFINIADRVSSLNPELNVQGKRMLILDETASLHHLKHNFICLAGYDRKGQLPNWHRKFDTVDKIESSSLLLARNYLYELIKELEKEGLSKLTI